ncbi:restriction endonuclease subunit S [Vibrio casei]|uniref:restriction endonuclease subunit S n=1 Tax=Vibrio casei TaxID=673372 RepID=UPI003F9CFA2D
MKKVALSSLCDVKNGYAYKSKDYTPNGYRVIRITNVQKGRITSSGAKYIPDIIADKTHSFKLRSDDILISLTGNVGRVGIIRNSHLPAVLNQRVGLIRVKSEDLFEPYLFNYLNSDAFEQLAINNSKGVAQLNLSSKWVEKHEIPLPSLNDQKRISYLLSKVQRLISQRQHDLHQLDLLMSSIFEELFGDPINNNKQWRVKPLKTLLSKIDSGWSPKCESVAAKEYEWGVLKLGALTSGTYRQEENKAMLPNVEPKTQHEVKPGDLLFTRKNTHELVAATVYVHKTRPKLLLPDLIFRLVIRDKNEIHPIYLWRLLAYPPQRKKIQSLANGAAGSMPNISKANLKEVLLPVPDIELQLKFVEIVNKLESIKASFNNHFKDLKLLYGALSQRAFEGKLDLSAIQLPKESEREADSPQVENEHLLKSLAPQKVERVTRSFEPVHKSLEKIKKVTQPIEQITKSLEIITKGVDSLNLPKTTPDFSNDKIRQKWLVKLLKEQLTALDIDCLLALSEFWEFAQDWISNFEQEDGDSFSFSIDDYEVLKDFVFNEVRNGLLLQEYEEASNSIKFKVNNK